MKTIIIPFDGFYESITASLLELDIELENSGIDPNQPLIVDYELADGCFCNVAKKWADIYKDWLKNEHGLTLESLTFERLESPREYNFTTDRIFCYISDDDIVKLHKWALSVFVDHSVIQDRFSSKDGFHSFYDDFVHEWRTKPVLEWDYNELAVLMPTMDGTCNDLNYWVLWEPTLCNGFFYKQIELIYEGE